METALIAIGGLVVLVGAGSALTGKPLPWLKGQTAKPALWGAGYLLLGVCLVAMGILLHHRPAAPWFAAPLIALVAALALITLGSRGTVRRRRG